MVTNICAWEWGGGTIFLTVTGAAEPIVYDWEGIGVQGPMLGGVGPGVFSVLVTDANGCTGQMSIEVIEYTPIIAVQDSLKHIYGGSHGYIYITPGGGVPPYTFVWTDPVGTKFYSEDLQDVSVPGIYSLYVTDAVGCYGYDSYNIALYTNT
jgi:hypothetical protein